MNFMDLTKLQNPAPMASMAKQFESKYTHSTVNIQLQTVNTFHRF